MQYPTIARRKLFKKWIRVLQICTSNKKMNIMERINAIKLSADLAMASSRKGKTGWSRAIISGNANRTVKERLFGKFMSFEKRKKASNTSMATRLRRRKICRGRKYYANFMAKRLVQKKTKILRRIVPGGESIDDNDLIDETLDYIASLKAQIDVMRCLANAN